MKNLLKRKAIVLGIIMTIAFAGLTLTTQSCNCDVKNDSKDKVELPAVKKIKEEGKCGEGKCGSKEVKEEKSADSKCGEGKCGEGKCGEGK